MPKKSRPRKHTPATDRRIWLVIGGVVIILLACLWGVRTIITDTHCTREHTTTFLPPVSLTTAEDWFAQANYDYDVGSCYKAIMGYTRAIQLDPTHARAYNNRAYTFMRLRDYRRALPDLNRAIELRPDYANALVNRGDLYNYYGPIIDMKKAIADYDRVIALGDMKNETVCGHRAVAISKIPGQEGWNAYTWFRLIGRSMTWGCSIPVPSPQPTPR